MINDVCPYFAHEFNSNRLDGPNISSLKAVSSPCLQLWTMLKISQKIVDWFQNHTYFKQRVGHLRSQTPRAIGGIDCSRSTRATS